MKTRIYFPIEIHRREFLSRIIFSLKAANKGFSVVIGAKEEIYSKLNLDLIKLQIENELNLNNQEKKGKSEFIYNKLKRTVEYEVQKNY